MGPVTPLPAELLRPPGSERHWPAYNATLVARGQLSWMFKDQAVWQTQSLGPLGGRPAYSAAAMAVCLVVRAADDLDWRSTEGRVNDLAALTGWGGRTPDYSTMALRAADPEVTAAVKAFLEVHDVRRNRRRGPVVVLVDSTGVTLAGPGGYQRDKHQDPRRGKYHVLHIATDARTGEVLEFELTESTRCKVPDEHKEGIECDCPKVGDAPVAEKLLTRLVEAGLEVVALVGDGAYSGTPLRACGLGLGVRVVAPLPSNSVYRSESKPGEAQRNDQLMHERHLGPAEWKKRVGYHVRSSVEADIGSFKSVLGEKVRSKRFERAVSEVGTKLLLRNLRMAG